jgi:hypothetical protein
MRGTIAAGAAIVALTGAMVAGSVAAAPSADAYSVPGTAWVTGSSNTYVKVQGDGGKTAYVNPGQDARSKGIYDVDRWYAAPGDVRYTLYGVPVWSGWHSVKPGFDARIGTSWR